MKGFIIPRDYMQDRSSLPELNFEPTLMYVANDMGKGLKLMMVVGKYNDCFVAFPTDTYWGYNSKINCELFRFAIKKEEAEKYALTDEFDKLK